MNFFLKLWFTIRAIRSMVGTRHNVDWTISDSNAFKIFLNSQTGRRFVQAMRNSALEATSGAVFADPQKLISKAGYAQGFQSAFALVCRLSATDPLQLARHDGKTALTESSAESPQGHESEDSEPLFWGDLSSSGSTIE